jgi:glycosyltransferase involved in cell wall biosynthesis
LVVKACTLLSRHPDLITANSHAGMKSHLELGYRPRRGEIVANGIDVEMFKPDPLARAAVRAELGLAADAIVLAHVARVDPMKDHASLLAAMRLLPDLQVVLIGAGTESLAAAGNVIALGRRDDVPRLMAAADFIVSSSSFGEGFSNAIAEGMACGLPPIATNTGDAHLIVGDTGLIVQPSDPAALAAAIQQLSREPETRRAERGMRARARIIENYSMPLALERWQAVYETICHASRNGSS